MDAQKKAEFKRRIKREAAKLGADITGFAPVDRWDEYGETPEAFRPGNIWPWCRTVISMGVQIFPSMIETTPSVVYSELYNTTNRLLDEAAYRLAAFLNRQGYRAHFFPRDCYGDISVLVKKPEAAFSHVLAAKYAGLGTIGWNHTLITREFGPRVRIVSVITDADITADPVISEELCIHCGLCRKKCPMQAFGDVSDNEKSCLEMDKFKCAEYHQQLKNEFRYPCGVCTAVCPVGEDRRRYGSSSVSKEGIEHCQSFGSANIFREG